MIKMKVEPATPLPWAAAEKSPSFEPIAPLNSHYTIDDDGIHFDPADLKYLVAACNAFPALMELAERASSHGAYEEADSDVDAGLRAAALEVLATVGN